MKLITNACSRVIVALAAAYFLTARTSRGAVLLCANGGTLTPLIELR